MAGRGLRPMMLPGGMPPPRPGLMGPGGHPGMMGGPPGGLMPPGGPPPGFAAAALEQKLIGSQGEIQKLLQENQRLAATHVALRQELAAAQGELQRTQNAVQGVQAEKEQHVKGLLEKMQRMEQEMRAAEGLKQELHAARMEVQGLVMRRQEAEQGRMQLGQALQQANQELAKWRQEAGSAASLRQELGALRQELQAARTALEFERKANSDQLEQRQALEKNLVEMARENEKLRMGLPSMERNTMVSPGLMNGPSVQGYGGGMDGQALGASPYGTYPRPYGTDSSATMAGRISIGSPDFAARAGQWGPPRPGLSMAPPAMRR